MTVLIYLLLPALVVAALAFTAGLALFRGGGHWKWFGATLMAAAVVMLVFWVVFLPA